MFHLLKQRPGAILREKRAGNKTGISSVRILCAWMKTFLANRYFIFILFLLIYSCIMQEYGGLMALLPAWRLEIPLVLYLYYYFNLITHNSKWQSLVTAIPIILLYSVFDVYHLQLGRLLRVTEVTEIPEMLWITPMGIKIILVLIFGMPLLAFLRLLRLRRIPVMILGILPLFFLIMTAEFAPEFFLNAFQKTQKPIITFSDIKSAGDNGRFVMMLYNEAKRKTFIQKLALYKGNSSFLKEFDNVVAKLNSQEIKNNVHLIVLESFFDPELLHGATFSQNPTHPKFKKIFKDKGSLSISPVFGGGTAQAEFEALCGVPAMRELSSVEFDAFSGQRTLCLPNLLLKSGYHTIATNAFVPDFFNAVNAYEGLGFEKSYYPREYAAASETYLSTGDVKDEKYMFDGDLFKQNLTFIGQWMDSNPGVPLFNYIMSIYGHTPNMINTTKRPKIINIKGAIKDEQLERAVNQYYYRTEAIADFLNKLQTIDPKSLVILVSDHIPPLVYGPNTYKKLNYLYNDKDFMHINRIFFFENGKAVHYKTIHHYDIPYIILNYITNGNYCITHNCDFKNQPNPIKKRDYREAYMTIMIQAMNL